MVAKTKVVLTVNRLDALKPAPAGKRVTIWDGMQPHFGVRVSDKGGKSFVVVRRRKGGGLIWTKLGDYPGTTLKDARAAAAEALKLLDQGKKPKEAEAERLREEARKRGDTFGIAVAKFIASELAGLKTGTETEAILRRQFLGQTWQRVKQDSESDGKRAKVWTDGADPIWRDLPVTSIARRDVVERIDSIKRQGGKHAARHAYGALRKFFNWAADGERFGVEVSPCTRISDATIGFKKGGRELQRSRVLDDAELCDVWHAAGAAGYPYGPLVQLLMLTAQRLNDIAAARWTEINLDTGLLTVPAERFKTSTAQEVPLSAAAVDILQRLPRFDRGPCALTATAGRRPISCMTRMKERVDAAIAKRRDEDGRGPMPHWVLHDLRRTVRTRLTSDLGVDAYIAERVLGHALPGLHRVYDQGGHRPQKRDALDRWATLLAGIVDPTPPPPADDVVAEATSNVVSMPRRRRS